MLISLIVAYPYDAPPGFHWVPNGCMLEKAAKRNERNWIFMERYSI